MTGVYWPIYITLYLLGIAVFAFSLYVEHRGRRVRKSARGEFDAFICHAEDGRSDEARTHEQQGQILMATAHADFRLGRWLNKRANYLIYTALALSILRLFAWWLV